MKSYLRAFEVWAPVKDTLKLELVAGSYGSYNEFGAASRAARFAYGQGLPGAAWEAGHPILMDTRSSHFKRAAEAKSAGITTAIALPVFAGEFLKGVVVFLTGDDEDSLGAIEIWHCDTTSSYDMKLHDGHFGGLEHFEFSSRHTSFRPGTGLVGKVWESGLPIVLNDLGSSHQFVRFEGAKRAGLTSGLGIPVFFDPDQAYLMTFLSALGTPIARQIEVWLPDMGRQGLTFDSGYSQAGVDLNSVYQDTYVARQFGSLGRVLISGVPTISTVLEEEHVASIQGKLSTMLVIPVLERGLCKAVVALLL